ncbi:MULTISPECIES: tetratricopeptide repeat protein [unclassified Coleofasciculus]|uniref:tetratricopeptide repeat protein n=1 Tax=unclassified Coleofasciculus TaxID=2692782 RepID=UPI0018804A5A|nr:MULTISPECIES: tetratricopeptide repeat protein [unclassified Coleofasciculus]MBE9126497.1 tetratricopeptide repeat protein [Coleofasciculus sp. LEGE 07081]MBE9149906.1 tetratricopeptide repeat protein [Coleofasciculus sp. LEGE 07092]
MNSSKKLPSQLFPGNLNAEIGHFIAANQQEFAELLTFVDFAEKFTLGLVEVNFPPDAELLIEALKISPECRNIQFVTLNLFDPNLRFIRDEIIKILPTIEREHDKKLVLIVGGLEKSIGVFGDYPPVLQDLNFVRDAYKRTVPHPILFILPDYAITRLAKFAPDFWAWKSGIFRFKTTPATKDYAIAQTAKAENARGITRLATPAEQERIDLLHRLLMDYNPTGHQATGDNLRQCSNILHQLGVAYLNQKNPGKARDYLAEAVKLLNGEESAFYAEVLNSLGQAYYQQREFDKAIDCYQKSLRISQKLENRRGEDVSLFNLGNTYLELRQFQQARDFYQQCLEIEQQIGDRYECASTYHQLGIVAQQLREYEQARVYYQQALDIKLEFGDRYNCASTYHQLGMVAQQLREYEQARVYYQQALDITLEFCDRYNCASTYHQLGIVAQQLREYEQARVYYQQALDIYLEFGDRYGSAGTYHCLGLLAEAQEDYAEARANLQKALEIYVEFKDEYLAGIAPEVLEQLPDNSEN